MTISQKNDALISKVIKDLSFLCKHESKMLIVDWALNNVSEGISSTLSRKINQTKKCRKLDTQDLTKSKKHHPLTDSPTWIQEMLAHLKRCKCLVYYYTYLILVTTITTGGGVPFSSWCPFLHRERDIA